MLDLDGYNLNRLLLTNINIFNKKIFLRILFLIFLFVFGCARQVRQIRRIPQKAPTPSIRVALNENFRTGKLLFKGKFKLRTEEATYVLDESVGEFTVKFQQKHLSFRSPRRQFNFRNFRKIVFYPEGKGVFYWNGIPYSGEILFVLKGKNIVVINKLLLSEYLKGVIPSEIPSHNEEYFQAIKAQAVAARTYALYHIKHPNSNLFDVYADSRDQVYQGKRIETPLADKAVEETAGLILMTRDGRYIETQFHSTCGGMLEMRDDYGGNITRNKGFLNDKTEDEYNCVTSPLYRWVEKVDTRDILRNLVQLKKLSFTQAQKLQQNGFVLDIQILSRRPSGRIDRLIIQINEQSFILNERQIRRVLSPVPDKPLPSSLILFKSIPSQPDQFFIIGAGFGHGKGLCQWGAIGMALKKKSFEEILSFYYPDLVLKKEY